MPTIPNNTLRLSDAVIAGIRIRCFELTARQGQHISVHLEDARELFQWVMESRLLPSADSADKA